MSNLLSIQDEITTKLKELPQDVYETTVPDDAKVRHGANGLFLPYIVAVYADAQESATGQGIISVRYNSGVSFCAIECVAPTERAARQVADLVRDKLLGFMPTGAGELRPIGGQSYISNETNAVPKKYISEVAFRFTINAMV